MSFFAELKRRNVFKVAIAYAIVAWLLIQIAATVFPILNLPTWAAPLLAVFVIFGFPVALVLAWAYELTPEGIKETRQVSPAESIAHVTGQKLNLTVIGLLIVALAFVVVDAYVLDDSPSERPTVSAAPRQSGGASAERLPVSRVSINPSRGESWVISPHDPDFAIAPDGVHIAYIGRRGLVNHLVIRRLDEFEGHSLGSFGGVVRNPFFSPDGQWLGFVDGNVLKKASVRDGTAVTVGVLPAYMNGATWGTDDTIVIGTLNRGLYRVSASGGEFKPIETAALAQLSSARWPYFLPGDHSVLFAAVGATGTSEVRALSLDTGDEQIIVRGATFPIYTSSGHLLYVRDSILWAAAFDPEKLALVGEAVPVVDGVMIKGPRQTGLGSANVGISNNGTLVYRPVGTDGSGTSTLVWVGRAGREEPLGFEPRAYGRLQLSRDGTKVAVEITDANLTNTDIWVGEMTGRTLRRLTLDAGPDESPVWTSDGLGVAFTSTRDGGGLFLQAADGTGAVERLVPSEIGVRPWLALPDGSGIVFSGRTSQSAEFRFYRVALDGDHAPEELALYYGPVASISPDGKWLAFSSEETGNFEVYVEPYPNPSLEKWQITQGGGRDPVFSHDGTELYLQNDTTVFAVEITTDPVFSAGPPVALFDGPYFDSTGRWYDVAPDGRFLMLKPGWLESGQDAPLNVVLNWFDELERAFAVEN